MHSIDEDAAITIITQFPPSTELREEDGQLETIGLETKMGLILDFQPRHPVWSSGFSPAVFHPKVLSPKSFICIQLTRAFVTTYLPSCQRSPQKLSKQRAGVEIPQDTRGPLAQVQQRNTSCPDTLQISNKDAI